MALAFVAGPRNPEPGPRNPDRNKALRAPSPSKLARVRIKYEFVETLSNCEIKYEFVETLIHLAEQPAFDVFSKNTGQALCDLFPFSGLPIA